MLEFVLCIPFLALLIAGIFFLGWAMRNQQKVRTADRYASWRSLHDHVWSNNGRSMGGELNVKFFAEKGVGVSHTEGGGPTETREEYATVADEQSAEVGEYTEEFLTHQPRGRKADVSSDFETSIYRFGYGAIESRHVRDGRQWRREETGVRRAVLDVYLKDLEDAVENIDDGMMRSAVQNLYYNGW